MAYKTNREVMGTVGHNDATKVATQGLGTRD